MSKKYYLCAKIAATDNVTSEMVTGRELDWNNKEFIPIHANAKSLEKTRVKILQLIKENPSVSSSELAAQLKLSLKGVEWQLAQLKATNTIRRVGAVNGGHWEII